MAGMHESDVRPNLIAVDIGNSRIKLGFFRQAGKGENDAELRAQSAATGQLPEPIATLDLSISNTTGEFDVTILVDWCRERLSRDMSWLIASVHRAAAARLTSALADLASQSGTDWEIRQLTYRDVPLTIRVEQPERVGIDRLLAALAADRLRQRDRAAIIVDVGTAITVDLLEADGGFAGGAILPGVAMSARALEEQTDALPHVALEVLEKPPEPLGKSTVGAIESGIYWGTVGSIRELISQLTTALPVPPKVFVTGGTSAQMVNLLAPQSSVRHVSHLVLSGIALVKT